MKKRSLLLALTVVLFSVNADAQWINRVKPTTAPADSFLTAIGSDGIPTSSTVLSRLPALTGDVSSSSGSASVTVNKVQGTSPGTGVVTAFGTALDATGGLASFTKSAQHVATNAALAAASTASYPNGVWRDDYASGNGAPPLFFTVQSGTCAANSRVNDGGDCVNSSDGNSWLARTPGFYDVRQFGATPGNSADDDAPYIYAALNRSNAIVVFPAGQYDLKTTNGATICVSGCTVTGAAFNTPSVGIANVTKLTIIASPNAILNVTSAIPNAQALLFTDSTYLDVSGLRLKRDVTGQTTPEVAAISLFNIGKSRFHNISTDTGFGTNGASKYNTIFTGDWITDTSFSHIRAESVGMCTDFAYLYNVQFTDWIATGGDYTGSTAAAGRRCFSNVQDAVNASYNRTPYTYSTSTQVTWANNTISNFNSAFNISSGTQLNIIGNRIFKNPGGYGGGQGWGIVFDYIASGNTASTGYPVQHVNVVGNYIAENGGTTAGGGAQILQTASTSDVLSDIKFRDNVFYNNSTIGLYADGSTYISQIDGTNNTYTGASQTTGVGTIILAASSETMTAKNGTLSSLTTNVVSNLTSATIPPGRWLVSANIEFAGAATTTVNYLQGSIGTSSSAISAVQGNYATHVTAGAAIYNYSVNYTIAIPPQMIDVTSGSGTTYYCNAKEQFSISTSSARCVMTWTKR